MSPKKITFIYNSFALVDIEDLRETLYVNIMIQVLY